MIDTQAPHSPAPNERQILAAIGNRFVVFGSDTVLRDAPRFGPADVKDGLHSATEEEREGGEMRIARSLVVESFEVRGAEGSEFGDVELVDAAGQSILVEIRVGDRDFAGIDLSRAWQELGRASDRREIWGFNLEKLTLGIVWSDREAGAGFARLLALNVWSFDADGTLIDRSKVDEQVKEWNARVTALYDDVEAWAREEGLTTLRDRTIPMSEEHMQRYAVPDRDMPILDILDGKTSVMTMKPDGLWLLGFDGAIDVITRRETVWLVGLPRYPDPPVWTIVEPKGRKQTPWSRDVFMSVLGRVSTGE